MHLPPPPNPTGMAPLAKEPSSPGDGSRMPPPKTSTPFPGILHPHVWGHGDPHLNPRGGGSPAAPPGAGSPTEPYQPHPLPRQHPLYLSRKIGEVKRRRREAPGGQGGFCLSPFPADSAHWACNGISKKAARGLVGGPGLPETSSVFPSLQSQVL